MTAKMRRRAFISLLGGAAAAWPLAARAQQHKMLRVGFVGMQPREAPHYRNFLRRMGELGYQGGRNFTFDYIETPNVDGYDKSYRELAARKPDLFLAVGNEPALRAALSAADGKPIAFLAVDFDPLAKGYVANLSNPRFLRPRRVPELIGPASPNGNIRQKPPKIMARPKRFELLTPRFVVYTTALIRRDFSANRRLDQALRINALAGWLQTALRNPRRAMERIQREGEGRRV
jgi:hypothetical protein